MRKMIIVVVQLWCWIQVSKTSQPFISRFDDSLKTQWAGFLLVKGYWVKPAWGPGVYGEVCNKSATDFQGCSSCVITYNGSVSPAVS